MAMQERMQVLYQARIYPEAAGPDLSEAQLNALHEAIKSVVQLAVSVDADASRFPQTWLFHYRCCLPPCLLCARAASRLVWSVQPPPLCDQCCLPPFVILACPFFPRGPSVNPKPGHQ